MILLALSGLICNLPDTLAKTSRPLWVRQQPQVSPIVEAKRTRQIDKRKGNSWSQLSKHRQAGICRTQRGRMRSFIKPELRLPTPYRCVVRPTSLQAPTETRTPLCVRQILALLSHHITTLKVGRGPGTESPAAA